MTGDEVNSEGKLLFRTIGYRLWDSNQRQEGRWRLQLGSYRGISPTRAIWTPFCVPGGRSSARSPPAHRRLPPKLMARHLGGKPLSVGSPSHRHSASCSHVSAPSSHPTVDDSGSERVQVMRYLGGAGTLPQVWRILGPKVYSCLVSS